MRALERLVHRRRLVHPAGDRLEVGDVERIRIQAAVPAHDIERVPRVRQLADPLPVPDQDRYVLATHDVRLDRAPQVPLAVRRVLQELPLGGQVAPRRSDVSERLDGQHPHRLVTGRHHGVRRRRRDDDVVAGAHPELAEDGGHASGALLDVQALVAGGVAVQRRGPVGGDVPDPDVAVDHQLLPAGHRVRASGVQLVRLVVPGQQGMVRRGEHRRLAVHPTVDDRRRKALVVEQGRVVGEALDTHQLLGVQAAVGLAEGGVALARDLTHLPVERHASPYAGAPVGQPPS